MRKRKKKKYYALPCMMAILVLAGLLTAGGMLLRRTLLKGLPQYDNAPDMAIPMMLLQDSGPLREARQRAEWEARQDTHALATAAQTPQPTEELRPENETPPPEERENEQEQEESMILVLPEEEPPQEESTLPALTGQLARLVLRERPSVLQERNRAPPAPLRSP